MSLTAKPASKRLQRGKGAARVHSPPLTPTYYGEEDLFFPPAASSSSNADAPPTPTSPTFSSPRSTSPQQGRFKKLSNKLKGRDELDFGCAGDWSSAAGPSDLGDRYYSSNQGGNRTSSASSMNLPSLTHSRGHSSSSEFSTYTFDSSLPPSPTPSSCASMTSVAHSSPSPSALPPLSYTSRVPLTPRTAQRHRQADETAAVEALTHFFNSVRLSQIKEDVSPCATARGSFASSPPTAADILLSKNHAPPAPPVYKSSHPTNDFEIEFIDSGRSTFTPLEIPPSAFSSFSPSTFVASSPSSHSDGSSFSNDSTVHTHSPIPDQDVAVALDELSEYFTSAPSSPVHARAPALLPSPRIISSNIAKRPHLTNEKRPTRTAAAGVRIGLSPVSPPERRVQYSWI